MISMALSPMRSVIGCTENSAACSHLSQIVGARDTEDNIYLRPSITPPYP